MKHAMGHPRGQARMDMHEPMSHADRRAMLLMHHRATIWLPVVTLMLGLWLAASPVLFAYRSGAHAWVDASAGVLVVLLAGVWLVSPFRFLAQWAIAAVGFWELMAPLFFWSGPAEYTTDTIIGTFLIAAPLLIGEMPGMMMVMEPGPKVPPGWSYNPSSWLQRAPIIALAFISFFASRHLAAYQLGHISVVWDPFFDDGTRRVLTSEVSRAWPISDAGLGAVSYLLEALMGFMGGQDRWRTMPWMVTIFGILVVPLGVVSIVLIILQPVAVGAWCTLCLFTAALMLVMIPLTLDEVWAMGEFLIRSRRQGKPFWRTFFFGGTLDGGKLDDERIPPFGPDLSRYLAPMFWGVSLPWTLLASAAIGVWLMFAPDVLGSSGRAADTDHIFGALIVTWSVVVMAEVARTGRFLNSLFGLWIAAVPWVVSGYSAAAHWNATLAGLLLIVLAIPRGPLKERYGLSDWYIRTK